MANTDLGNVFFIHEANMDNFERKMRTVENKCTRYGCDFEYKIIGEEMKVAPVRGEDGKFIPKRDPETGNIMRFADGTYLYVEMPQKFIKVYVNADFRINGWECIASVDRLDNGKNVITSFSGKEVPTRFYNMPNICEHCNTNRNRKYLFIIHNVETNEYKQIGKSCLMDYTRGMNASFIAWMNAQWKELEEYDAPTGGSGFVSYYDRDEALLVIAETIRCFGYVKRYDFAGNYNSDNTYDRSNTYLDYLTGRTAFWTPEMLRKVKQDLTVVGFNHNTEQNREYVKKALEWLDRQNEENSYIHNLKSVVSLTYVKMKHFGILASLFSGYDKALVREAERKEEEKRRQAELEAGKVSEWQGEPRQKLSDIKVESFKYVRSGESQFGYWHLYEFKDVDGNIYKWFASRKITLENIVTLTGIVKSHDEFKGVKSTMLTRCKVS